MSTLIFFLSFQIFKLYFFLQKSYRELPTPEEYESKTGNNRKSSSKKKSSFDEDII